MADKVGIYTDFVTVATAGRTLDGRKITDKMLDDAAGTYDTDLYTAVIDAEHWYGNYGTVRELKIGEDKSGNKTLEAKLAPSSALLNQGEGLKRLFTSVSLLKNFKGTGKYYLIGLAITNSPASTGTTELNFSNENKEKESFQGSELNFDIFKNVQTEHNTDNEIPENIKKGFCSLLKDFFTHKNEKNEFNNKDNEMTEEQYSKLIDGIGALNTKIDNFTKPKEKNNSTSETPPAKTENSDFSKVTESLNSFTTAANRIIEKFGDFLKKPAGQTAPPSTGAADGNEDKFIS